LPAFAVLVLIGFGFRTFALLDVPSGLTWDEGAEGLEAVALFHGRFPVFFPEHGGHEPLLIYLQAASLKVFGWSPFALRLPTVFLTTLAVAATFLAARRLFGWRVAWLATLLQAVALWQVAMSRMGIRPAALVLFGALAVYWLATWLRPPSPSAAGQGRGEGSMRDWRAPLLCGLCTGLATYAYTPGRFLVLLVALAWLARLLLAPKSRLLARQGLAAGATAGLVFAPLGWYFLSHPGTFSERADELSIFNPAFGPPLLNWLRSVKAALLMFSFAGETGWDKNIAHQPMFGPVVSVLFVAGVALALWRLRRPAYLLALAWLAVMVLPLTLTAKDLPDFGRVSGAAPAVFLFPAITAATIWRRWPATAWLWAAGAASLIAVSGWQYFGVWANAEGRRAVYRPEVLSAGQEAIGRLLAPDAPRLVYFGTQEPFDAVTDFLIAGLDVEHPELSQRLIGYDARYTRVLPPAGSESYLIAAGRPPIASLPSLRGASQTDAAATMEGFDVPARAAPGEELAVRAEWTPQPGFGGSFTLFAHLVDYAGERTLASFDHNGFPAGEWQGGEKVLSTFPLTVPSDASPGAYWVEFGAYTDGGRRLPQADGQDHLLLGPLIVAPPAAVSGSTVARLGGQVDLLQPAIQRSGQELHVSLDWLPAGPLERDYSVFLHVLNGAGTLVAQSDGPPAGGEWPARYWLAGVPVHDVREVRLPADLPAGQYRVTAGLYRLDRGERLAASPSGPEPGSALVGTVDLS
jgi:hypothetical protein